MQRCGFCSASPCHHGLHFPRPPKLLAPGPPTPVHAAGQASYLIPNDDSQFPFEGCKISSRYNRWTTELVSYEEDYTNGSDVCFEFGLKPVTPQCTAAAEAANVRCCNPVTSPLNKFKMYIRECVIYAISVCRTWFECPRMDGGRAGNGHTDDVSFSVVTRTHNTFVASVAQSCGSSVRDTAASSDAATAAVPLLLLQARSASHSRSAM